MKKQKRVISANLGYVSGILLILAGYSAHNEMITLILNYATKIGFVSGIATILLYIITLLGTLGGFTVILGSYAVARNHIYLGKFLLSIGSGFGLIELIIYLGTKYGGNFITGIELFVSSILGFGIILAIIARGLVGDWL
ncbi:MAG: hypothetical protein ACPL1Y_00435 [Thermoplasmata archaeon]